MTEYSVGYIGNYYKIPEFIFHNDNMNLKYIICENNALCDDLLTFSLVRNVPMYSVSNSSDLDNIISDLAVDFWIMCSFSIIISKNTSLKYEIYNIHYAGLPNYKGRHPTFWATVNNERRIGITIHRINSQMDSGYLVAQKYVEYYIWLNENQLFEQLTACVPDLLRDLLDVLNTNKECAGINYGSYYKPVSEIDYTIDKDKDTYDVIYNKIRAQSKYKGAVLCHEGLKYFIKDACFTNNNQLENVIFIKDGIYLRLLDFSTDSISKMIAIMQPTYMPWLGYFAMMDQADEFVFLDSVQLSGRSWQVRNKIKFNGSEKMLTIPIDKSVPRDGRLIVSTPYFDESWKQQHLDIIYQAYHKAPFFQEVFDFIKNIYANVYDSVGKFTEAIIVEICKKIGIDTPFYYSSSIESFGTKDELLANICKNRDANIYLSAQGSADYIEKDTPGGCFSDNEIELLYMNYEHPVYNQQGSDFISHLGIFDLLFNEGFDNALNIIRSGEKSGISYVEYRNMMSMDNYIDSSSNPDGNALVMPNRGGYDGIIENTKTVFLSRKQFLRAA